MRLRVLEIYGLENLPQIRPPQMKRKELPTLLGVRSRLSAAGSDHLFECIIFGLWYHKWCWLGRGACGYQSFHVLWFYFSIFPKLAHLVSELCSANSVMEVLNAFVFLLFYCVSDNQGSLYGWQRQGSL
jgi:hypothetical protein